MRKIKFIICILAVATLPFCFIACKDKSDDNKESKIFVGVAIYQKLDGNLNWSKFNAKPSAVNNIISTKDDKIILDEEPELLFFVYAQSTITSETSDGDYISNTTKDKVTISDSTLSFRFERIVEDTDILIYYIYKLESGDYFLELADTKTNLTKETENFELNFTHSNFSKIKLTLEKNLTINEEY